MNHISSQQELGIYNDVDAEAKKMDKNEYSSESIAFCGDFVWNSLCQSRCRTDKLAVAAHKSKIRMHFIWLISNRMKKNIYRMITVLYGALVRNISVLFAFFF